ncbi:UNVERIFIED_CONTAM: hypothetical protein RMT77_019433 [Armadillidium vulgare]
MFLKVTILLAGILLLLISLTKAQCKTTRDNECPNLTIAVNNHCYMFPDQYKKWNDASKYCEDKGGYLFIPDISYELVISNLSYVYPKIKENYMYNSLWVGAYGNGSDISFKWANGTELLWDHPNWFKGFPLSGTSLCVSVYRIKDVPYSLRTKGCNDITLFICQFDRISSSP